MANAIYFLCALTSAVCAVLLLGLFWRHRRRATRLALWSSLVFADLAILQTGELAIARAATACAGGALLLVGLIWETE